MRYTCLDVRSPDVNFLRKVMSSSRHDRVLYSRHHVDNRGNADIVPFPCAQHFSRKYQHPPTNIFDMAAYCRGVLRFEAFEKPVAWLVIRISSAVSGRRYHSVPKDVRSCCDRLCTLTLCDEAHRTKSTSVPRFLYPATTKV